VRKLTSAKRTLSYALAPLALVIGPALAWGHTPDAPASEVPGDWLWLGALLVASLFVLRARGRPRSRPTASRPLLAHTMSRRRWLSVAVTSVVLFYAAEAPPHTVHHGLDHVNPQECPVLAVSGHTNGELANDPCLLSLTPLPFTGSAPIFDPVPLEKPPYKISRTRAPPSLSV
jgi:hypothetical protein